MVWGLCCGFSNWVLPKSGLARRKKPFGPEAGSCFDLSGSLQTLTVDGPKAVFPVFPVALWYTQDQGLFLPLPLKISAKSHCGSQFSIITTNALCGSTYKEKRFILSLRDEVVMEWTHGFEAVARQAVHYDGACDC